MSWLSSLLGGGIVGSVERIALEAIETNQEKADARAVLLKSIDPNGQMRRQLSKFASTAYGFYLVATTILIFMHSFEIGDPVNSKEAMEAMTDLFLPITGSWATIVTASFGVNGVNAYKAK